MKKLIYSVGGYDGYLNWLKAMGFKKTNDLDEADTVFFAGGSDIGPHLYGEKKGPSTYTNSPRDLEEVEIFNLSKDKYKIGVCRGSQLLTALSGYKLVQDSDHPYIHDIVNIYGQKLKTNSMHHQQGLLIPNKLIPPANYKLLGWAENISRKHLNGDNKDYNFDKNYKEPEITYFDNKSIGFQMHPEMMLNGSDLNKSVGFFQELVDLFMNDKIEADSNSVNSNSNISNQLLLS